MSGIRVQIDESFCEGIGYCARMCPEVFTVDPLRRKAIVRLPIVAGDLIAKVELAESTCPTRAIVVLQDDV